MSLDDESPGRLSQPTSGEFGDYQAISVLAVASLLAGVASATALVGILLWIVPLVGILLSWLALVRIARSAGALTGRSLALAGLGLAVCFGTAAVTAWFNSQRLVAGEAHQVAGRWFRALAQGDTELAHQWTLPVGARAGLVEPEQLKAYYENDKNRRDQLAKFVGQKPIAILLKLGTRAHLKWESTTGPDDQFTGVSQAWQVTADGAGGPVRFTVELLLERKLLPGQQLPRWIVRDWRLAGPEPPIPVD